MVVLAGLAAIPPYFCDSGLKGVPGDREPLADIEVPDSTLRSYW